MGLAIIGKQLNVSRTEFPRLPFRYCRARLFHRGSGPLMM